MAPLVLHYPCILAVLVESATRLDLVAETALESGPFAAGVADMTSGFVGDGNSDSASDCETLQTARYPLYACAEEARPSPSSLRAQQAFPTESCWPLPFDLSRAQNQDLLVQVTLERVAL